MALMFLNGDGMRGGRAHHTIEGVPLVGERRTAAKYRFFAVRDQFPGLYPATGGDGQPILGELYDVPMDALRALLDTEPPELELTVIELDGGELSFAMVLRDSEHEHGGHKDISAYGGWRAYRASVPPPAGADADPGPGADPEPGAEPGAGPEPGATAGSGSAPGDASA
ncbi:MAG TPA: gamma-glutamylcyclotransferase [Streptosporangiaceae bacterium]|nr:gamma-glutamylcyclotransferase [Streptosporangiaceae bacterium]